MTAPAIETKDLVFRYGERLVLDRISLSLAQGEMIAILGPNGSGKTTLLKVLSAVVTGSGTVALAGSDIQSYKRRELSQLFAVVPQESQVNFSYTVAEIVLMGRASRHHPLALEGQKDLELARQSMELTETLPLAERFLHELSGGEKQRVMIARALAQEPRILLLDEPSAFLDLKHQVRILALLQRLNRERGLTIVAALHDLNLAAIFFPRLILLSDGKIFRDGSPDDVLTETAIEQAYGIRVEVERNDRGQCQIRICPPA